jgi:outer membrane receptor protein involved in Fe transport
MNKRLLILVAACVCVFAGTPVMAQSTTAGGVQGTITDNSGAALPGVTLELAGPAMQGTRSTVSGADGKFAFRNVPPGEDYKVTATLSGFAPLTKTLTRVYLGQEATVNFELRAAVTEAITVTAEAPLVDVTKTTTGVNVTARQFESLPTQRTFQQLTVLAPGVNMEMGDSRSNQLANSPNVGASSAPENNYIIDGLSTTDARYGTSGTNLTMNFVEEVQVMTGGYSAEFGRSTGGVFNVITKSGGNEFSGDAFAYFSDSSWSDKRVGRETKGLTIDADLTESQDYGASLGGPIMRDRLWFFAAFNPSRRTIDVGETSPLIGDSATEFEQETNYYAGKLTFTINPNHTIIGTAFGDPTTLDGWQIRGLTATPAEAGSALRKSDIGSTNLNLRYNGIVNPNWLVEVNVGQHKRDNTLGPATATGESVPRQIDETIGNGFQRGGFQRTQNDESQRDAYSIKASNFFTRHELRYGLDIENNGYTADTHETWYRWFGDSVQERIYSVDGSGDTANEAIFVQDRWTVKSNFQFNLGLRWERQRMESARGVFVASDPDEVLAPTHADDFTLDNNWSPRLGVVWDPRNNGRSKVYAYAGRFYEAIPLDLNIRALNGEDYIISTYRFAGTAPDGDFWFNPTGNPIPAGVRSGAVTPAPASGWYKSAATVLTAATATPLDTNLKAQYQDEFILGGELQFRDVWSAGLRLVDRELKRVIEDFGVFGDPSDPLLLTGYVIGNPGEGALGAPYAKPKRYYRAAELTVQRAFRDNWQFFASYTYARARGNYEGLFMSGYEQLDPNITALYDIPSFGVNALGRLRADRPVNLKVHSSYRFPFGLTVSEGFYFSSGIPYGALAPELYNGYGDGTIHLVPRGTAGRTPNFWNLDLHADYVLPFLTGTGRSMSVIVDIFNVTNQKEVLEVDQDYYYQAMDGHEIWDSSDPAYDPSTLDAFGNPILTNKLAASPFYGTPFLIQSPRSVQVGFKFTY